jgi:hypothetical protein
LSIKQDDGAHGITAAAHPTYSDIYTIKRPIIGNDRRCLVRFRNQSLLSKKVPIGRKLRSQPSVNSVPIRGGSATDEAEKIALV